MKIYITPKYLRTVLLSAGLFLGLASCEPEQYYELPEASDAAPTVDLASMNFTHEPGAGEIKLKWTKPENPEEAGFMYIKMTYKDPRDKKVKSRNISPYTDELLITDTRARYGNGYSFEFTPYSRSNKAGKSFVLEGCSSGPAPVAIKSVEREKLSLKELNTNAQETSEGPLEGLTDGNPDTYFHTSWNNPGIADYHCVNIDLGEEVSRLEVKTLNRKNNGGFPTEVKLYGIPSMDFAYESDFMENQAFGEYQHGNQTSGGEFTSPVFPAVDKPELEEPVRYLRYYAKGGSNKYWHLAEMEIYKVIVNMYNPETDEEEVEE